MRLLDGRAMVAEAKTFSMVVVVSVRLGLDRPWGAGS
jgi:hypothetical protein